MIPQFTVYHIGMKKTRCFSKKAMHDERRLPLTKQAKYDIIVSLTINRGIL
jgi:hypothetical protein